VNRSMFLWPVACALFLPVAAPVALWGQVLDGEAPRFRGTEIESGRPLTDVALVLQARYGRPVTYEDPFWQWRDDFYYRDFGGGGRAFLLIPHLFHLPLGLTPAQTPVLDDALIARVLDEYDRQIGGARFRVITSSFGLHIVPVSAKDANGRIAPARSPLDAVISIPRTTQAPALHGKAIGDAVTQATGIRTLFSAPGEDWFERLYAAPGGVLEWGVTGIRARDALIDLLSRSATTFSWHSYCSLNSARSDCTLNVRPVQVTRTDDEGHIAKVVTLEYDRCPTCERPPYRLGIHEDLKPSGPGSPTRK
jgi:hypothetical protein